MHGRRSRPASSCPRTESRRRSGRTGSNELVAVRNGHEHAEAAAGRRGRGLHDGLESRRDRRSACHPHLPARAGSCCARRARSRSAHRSNCRPAARRVLAAVLEELVVRPDRVLVDGWSPLPTRAIPGGHRAEQDGGSDRIHRRRRNDGRTFPLRAKHRQRHVRVGGQRVAHGQLLTRRVLEGRRLPCLPMKWISERSMPLGQRCVKVCASPEISKSSGHSRRTLAAPLARTLNPGVA